MERLSLLVPTRGRPESASRFLASARDRAAHPGFVEAVLYVDDDDQESKEITCIGVDVDMIVGVQQNMGAYNSACLERARGEIIILANDDIVVRTDGWDDVIRAMHRSVEDGIYLAYPNDLFKGEHVCTFPILSRLTCNLLINPFPAEYKGSFIDYHLLDVFKRLQRHGFDRIVYLERVIFEHMHYRLGKSPFDDTYRRRGRFDDDGVFLGMAAERRRAVSTLYQAIVTSAAVESSRTENGHLSAPLAVGQTGSLLGASLLDFDLPALWRARLFVWFIARKLAAMLLSASPRKVVAKTRG